MGITETRSRGQAVAGGLSSGDGGGGGANNPSLPSGGPMGGELIQDRAARYRLEKRMKRRKAQKQRQNMIAGIVMIALLGTLFYLGYRGLQYTKGTPTTTRVNDHLKALHGKVKDHLQSLQNFKLDAPHAGEGGGRIDLKKNLGRFDPRRHFQQAQAGVSNEKEKMVEEYQQLHAAAAAAHDGKEGSSFNSSDVAGEEKDAAAVSNEQPNGNESGGGGGRALGEELPHERTRRLEAAFAEVRGTKNALEKLELWADQINQDIMNNVAGGIRFIRSYLLPPLDHLDQDENLDGRKQFKKSISSGKWMNVHRGKQKPMKWETEWKEILREGKERGPAVDYTDPKKYTYPKLQAQPPPSNVYPVFQSLGDIMDKWNHDEDFEGVFEETLMHFNYSNPVELEMARRYREARIPFKLYDVPELKEANKKWTDDYLSENFASRVEGMRPEASRNRKASGTAEESPNNFFAFFTPQNWNVHDLGLPPVTDNDWSFRKWADHAKYADSVRLSPDKPHFYWQSGVPKTERFLPQEEWSFISRDLPSMSSNTETFFVWHPKEQKGIQCRFGERGVVAATHYDSGRNMVAMITGAKRYILSPPRACSKLGIFTNKQSPIYRHSLLNFAHIPMINDHGNNMSAEERAWLKRASTADAIDTVVKAGEVLYIPSFYFHYIISLQKSAQCNVRAGIDMASHPDFGGPQTVEVCRDPS